MFGFGSKKKKAPGAAPLAKAKKEQKHAADIEAFEKASNAAKSGSAAKRAEAKVAAIQAWQKLKRAKIAPPLPEHLK